MSKKSSNSFEAISGKLKKANTHIANLSPLKMAALLTGIFTAANAVLLSPDYGPPLLLKTAFNMAIKENIHVWTQVKANYRGDYACASNAISFATTQILVGHELKEIEFITKEDFSSMAIPVAEQELHHTTKCAKTTIVDLAHQVNPSADSSVGHSIGLNTDAAAYQEMLLM